jgi:hypothetical protein
MEVDMYDLNIPALSRIRHNDLLENAEKQRYWRKQQSCKRNLIVHLANRIRNLNGLSPKGQSQKVPDEIAAMKL